MHTPQRARVQDHINDTLRHKQYFIDASLKLINYLYKVNRDKDALSLARRCIWHDNSKLRSDEIKYFIKLPKEEPHKKRARKPLTEKQKKCLVLHWSRNRHHPEYFDDYHEMTELDIMEMCCDWYARTIQFGSDFIPFVKNVQQKRFGFDDEYMTKILFYCEILDAK